LDYFSFFVISKIRQDAGATDLLDQVVIMTKKDQNHGNAELRLRATGSNHMELK
jgi:hypothetical protein